MLIMVLSVFGGGLLAADLTREERDLQALGQQASAAGVPILLLMSASDCTYCATLKAQVLDPMEISGEYREQVVIREFMIDGMLDARTFDGGAMTPREFARSYDVSLTPTMLFLDSSGNEIAERIVGISNIDFALFYVEKHIEEASRKLR